MKILLVNKFHYFRGGSEKYYFTLGESLEKMGHEVSFFSMKHEKNLPCPQSKFFVKKRGFDGNFAEKARMMRTIFYSKEAYKNIRNLLVEQNPDIVILNLIHKHLTCSIIDAIKDYNSNIKIVWVLHDLITVCPSYTMIDGRGNICDVCKHGDFRNCFKKKCSHGSKLLSYISYLEAKKIKKRGFYNKVDLFICPSYFYQHLLEESKFTTSKIVCIKNPLPIETHYEINDSDKGYLLYCGRISHEKGVKTLIDAAINTNRNLHIVGTGPLEKELKEYAHNYKNIVFLGFRTGEELKQIVRDSRCVVLPSEWYENGPYSAIEAMSLGKPLIVSNYGGLPELVDKGINGYIFKTNQELIDCINSIFAISKEDYSMMCKESCDKIKDISNVETYFKKLYYELYEK